MYFLVTGYWYSQAIIQLLVYLKLIMEANVFNQPQQNWPEIANLNRANRDPLDDALEIITAFVDTYWGGTARVIARGSFVTDTVVAGHADLDVDVVVPYYSEYAGADEWVQFVEFVKSALPNDWEVLNQNDITRSINYRIRIGDDEALVDLFPKMFSRNNENIISCSTNLAEAGNDFRFLRTIPADKAMGFFDNDNMPNLSDVEKAAIILLKLWKYNNATDLKSYHLTLALKMARIEGADNTLIATIRRTVSQLIAYCQNPASQFFNHQAVFGIDYTPATRYTISQQLNTLLQNLPAN